MTKRTRSLVGLLAASALVLAACGDDESSGDEPTAEETAEATAEESTEEMSEEGTHDSEDMSEEMSEETAEGTAEATAEESSEEASEVLLVWADENRVDALQAVAPAFTEATGVEVQVELVTNETMRDQVSQAAPAGEGPDVFVGAHDWSGELAASGIIDPIDVSAKQDQFLQVALDAFNFEGQVYAVPYATEAVAMYRNTDLVPDAPATWDELLAACDAAAVANCVVVPGGGDGADAYHNYPFVSAFGGYIFAYDETTGFDASVVGLDTPEAVEGITFLEQQVADGVIPATNYDGAKNLFLEGEAAFWITGPWELGGLQEQDTVNFDVSLIPQIGDAPVQPFVGAQGFYLSAFSENALLAQSFLLDFVATDDVMAQLYDADPRGTAWVAQQAALEPANETFAGSAANGIPMPNIPQMGSVWGPLGDNVLLVRNGELGGADAMTTAAEAVRAAVAG